MFDSSKLFSQVMWDFYRVTCECCFICLYGVAFFYFM